LLWTINYINQKITFNHAFFQISSFRVFLRYKIFGKKKRKVWGEKNIFVVISSLQKGIHTMVDFPTFGLT